ncbi:MAG: M23 family metallopeptidase [Zetaproteobacteria bacterium]|nr:MAG: M23 family metallopeptidase [Zetaproteobacteria bacterium]
MHLRKEHGAWHAALAERKTSSRRMLAAGVIHDSLFESAARAGLDSRTTMNLVDIFSWDIDFARDMRDGDSFRVLYDELYDDEGRLIATKILAAEFINQGQRFRAVLFTGPDGREEYFTPEGRSMRKAYLKAPVKFTRISSRFRLRRKHPILGFTRAHRGVDYAAPMGTPVHAIGDGRVRFVGWKGGYGRFVLIQHVNRAHSTAYAHLSRFARGLHRGMRVRQGQIIGYVGMSGLATGPHLHFEFRVRGRAIDPLTVKRVPSRPVPKSQMARFKQQSAPLLAALEAQPVTMLAWE